MLFEDKMVWLPPENFISKYSYSGMSKCLVFAPRKKNVNLRFCSNTTHFHIDTSLMCGVRFCPTLSCSRHRDGELEVREFSNFVAQQMVP